MKNQIYRHPGQPNMQVEVILASQGPDQDPVYTVRMRYPRIIHGEVMTHRVFNRNAGSSRAQPASVTIQNVLKDPFIPWHWGKNQSGMQADVICDEFVEVPYRLPDDSHSHFMTYMNHEAWSQAALHASDFAEGFSEAGYHKQVFNRLIEPFSWIDVLITATEWDNFLWLRNHEMAEPHLRDLAVLVSIALEGHKDKIQKLDYGQWHTPYITDEEKLSTVGEGGLLMMSAARTCRISYKPFGEDQINIVKDLQRFHQLTGGDRIHASPLEHQCQVDKRLGTNHVTTHFFGESEPVTEELLIWAKGHLHGNLNGYVQFRKIFRGERFGR